MTKKETEKVANEVFKEWAMDEIKHNKAVNFLLGKAMGIDNKINPVKTKLILLKKLYKDTDLNPALFDKLIKTA